MHASAMPAPAQAQLKQYSGTLVADVMDGTWRPSDRRSAGRKGSDPAQPRSFGATARHSHASADKHSRGRAASKRKAAVGAYLYQWVHSRLRSAWSCNVFAPWYNSRPRADGWCRRARSGYLRRALPADVRILPSSAMSRCLCRSRPDVSHRTCPI